MLVLSRKEKERILFPELGVAIQVIRTSSNAVRVGIEAPAELAIVREELIDAIALEELKTQSRNRRHAIRNRLNTANLALHVTQKQLEAGNFDEAEKTLQSTLRAFSELNDLIATKESNTSSKDAFYTEKRRALLVEDNPQERELLAGYLRLNGYEVDVAADGLEALQYLEEHSKPDLVLLDMQMPRMDGCQTVLAIRRNESYQDLKVFAVSGSDSKTLNINWGDRGVDRWFSKPLNPDAFVTELNRELGVAHI